MAQLNESPARPNFGKAAHRSAAQCAARLAMIATLVVAIASWRPEDARATSSLPSPVALRAMLHDTRLPSSDLIALYTRLKLHQAAPLQLADGGRQADVKVGHVDRFFVSNGSTNGFTRRTATLVVKTAHAYFYVEQGIAIDRAALSQSAIRFEQRTYPTDRMLFGSEQASGSRENPHITIFNGHVPGAAAYFSSADMFPRAVNPFSNERKMIYVNLETVQPGNRLYDLSLAHELQHLIHYRGHPADEAWINEGTSVLAQVLNGYDATHYDVAKAHAPGTPLDAFDAANFDPYYGGGYLWMLYLYEHFGGARVTRLEIADRGLSHMALFDQMLARLGSAKDANQVFADWVVANLLNDRRISGGIYGYEHPVPVSSTTASGAVPFSWQRHTHQYAADYLAIANPHDKPFTLSFSGSSTVPLLNAATPATGYWWSNRGDGVDTSLTLPDVSLQAVPHATLRYRVWYDLETDYDYGYVEISTDGGKTWYAQRTAHTTSSNPNGANLAIGYTGSSCSPASMRQGCWLDEQIDLSAYRGKHILIRFEQVTDDEYNGQGLAISGLRIPEIGLNGDASSHGWHAAGWVRAGNYVAEQWIVQAILYTSSGKRVLRMPLGAGNRGSLRIPSGTSRVIVVVSAVAPLTTLQGQYRISGG
jgi:immune inhibitor A